MQQIASVCTVELRFQALSCTMSASVRLCTIRRKRGAAPKRNKGHKRETKAETKPHPRPNRTQRPILAIGIAYNKARNKYRLILFVSRTGVPVRSRSRLSFDY